MGFYMGRKRYANKGFLIGGTAGRTTGNGEGLQHQDGTVIYVTPNIKAYDLSYGYEIAVVVHHGLKDIYEKNHDCIYYITVENENYEHPPIPAGVSSDIVKGLYKIKATKNPTVRLLGSGPDERNLKSRRFINKRLGC